MLAAGRESPFTWGIPAVLGPKFYPETYMPVTFKEQPVIALMNGIMQLYCDATRNDWVMADQKVQVLHRLRQQTDLGVLLTERISFKVLEHILFSTIHNVYTLSGNADLAGIAENSIWDITLPPLPDESDLRIMMEATLLGCQAMAFYVLYECNAALVLAQEAVDTDPKCPLWHFVLYQSLRRVRRMSGYGIQPSREEKDAIGVCVALSPDPFYTFYKAEMVKAHSGNQPAGEIILSITNRVKPDLLLRISEGLLDCGFLKDAKKWLERCPQKNIPMYLHQQGVLWQRKGAYRKAAEKFTAAAQSDVLISDLKHIECYLKGENYSVFLTHLQNLLEKYTIRSDRQIITLLIGLFYYELEEYDVAVDYLLEGILMDPNESRLKDFPRVLCLKEKSPDRMNIMDYLRKATYEYFNKGLTNEMVANSMETLRWLCRRKLFWL